MTKLKIEDVEDVFRSKIYWKIPNNYFTIMSAINKGIPVGCGNPESNISSKLTGSLQQSFLTTFINSRRLKRISRKPLFNFKNLFK